MGADATMTAIRWSQPTDFGLRWFDQQRLPEPFTEIDVNGYLNLMHCGSYGPTGYNYQQTFLDWGEGPLYLNPEVNFRTLSEVLYEPELPQAVYNYDKEFVGYVQELRKEGWAIYRNAVVKMPNGDLSVLPANTLYVRHLWRGHGGWKTFQNFWEVSFYFFFTYGVAVARNYGTHEDIITGKGIQLERKWARNNLRFFRVGCEHEYHELGHVEARKMGFSPLDRFDHCYVCDKCGHSYMVNSSD